MVCAACSSSDLLASFPKLKVLYSSMSRNCLGPPAVTRSGPVLTFERICAGAVWVPPPSSAAVVLVAGPAAVVSISPPPHAARRDAIDSAAMSVAAILCQGPVIESRQARGFEALNLPGAPFWSHQHRVGIAVIVGVDDEGPLTPTADAARIDVHRACLFVDR